jgi:RecA-family ATPase
MASNTDIELEESLARIRAEAAQMPTHRPAMAPPAPLATISAASLAGLEVPVREFLVDGMIPLRTPCLLSGDGGVGKTLAALQMAISVSTGAPWLGKEVIQGPCIFITAEDEMDEVHRRLFDICEGEKIDIANLADLHLCSLAGMDAVLGQADGRTNAVTITRLFSAVRAKVAAVRPALLILDTLADLFSGDENNRMQARQFIGHLRSFCTEYGTTVVLLAHPSLSGLASGSGTSGSTAWNNSVRSRLFLRRPYPDPRGEEAVDPNLRVLETMKANYGKVGQSIELRWIAGRLVAEDQPELPSAHDIDDIILAVLKTALKLGRKTTVSKIGATLADIEGASAINRDKRKLRTDIRKAVDRMLTCGKLRLVEKGPPSDRTNHVMLPD